MVDREITKEDLVSTFLQEGKIDVATAVSFACNEITLKEIVQNINKMITHDTPTSNNIARLQYDPETADLFIEFRSGKTYKYSELPMDIWNAFISAPSAGKFFNSTIRGVYKESAV